MKKRIGGLLVAIAVSLAAAGCKEGASVPESSGMEKEMPVSVSPVQPDYQDGTLTYSNLAGDQSRREVEEILLAAGIPEKYVDMLFLWVNDFNQCMSKCETFHLIDGFVTEDIPVVDYGDYYPMSTAWFKTNQRKYGDVLCRIAAFLLMQDQITAKALIEEELWECWQDTQWLCSDNDAISNNPLIDFDQKQQRLYYTVYNPVTITPGCTAEEMAACISEEWQRRGISFAEGRVSLITIWTQYEAQTAAAHAAVLVQDGDAYLLLEKTNPQSPYQATRFSTVEQVKQYMYESIHIEDVRYDMETGTYIVMENDRML